ncbi:butyrophilin subfamily 1 member A1-like [Pagrus major]|uniref:butyrophilin subfamily 1 member A1-like n=1 Tax=Pagrus major TaxID=143350 RepID=UPI003CC87C39
MGCLMMRSSLMAAVFISVCAAAPVSESFVVMVTSPVSVQRGHVTTLPCWLNPSQSAEGVEVRWYRGDGFQSPVMLYRAKKFENASQEASYAGRVSFGSKDTASGGLTAGDVSLKLVDVTLKDAGDYTCYVSSDQAHDSASVRLDVTETGTPLLLSAVSGEDNLVNVSCESGGWYPAPTLRWSDQKQVLTPKSLKYSKESSGLQSVHSWVLVSSSSVVSCSVGLSGEEAKEASMRLDNAPQPSKQESGSSAAGWVAFALLLIVMLAGLGVLYFKKKREKKTEGDEVDAGETQKLLSKDLSTFKKHYVNVTLVETENPHLKIKDLKLRDAKVDQSGASGRQKVTCLTAIRGKPEMSSGQHYWEVSLGNITAGIKQSWWLGVTSATAIPQESDFSPTASNGYWFLSSSSDSADSFQFSTEPQVSLPVYSRPQTVGVYLNYNSGELSFYNVEQESLIGSLTAKFRGEVFPFFNPGEGDRAPMEILHHSTKQD